MRPLPPRRAPLWFVVIVAAACAVLVRVCAPAWDASADTGAPHAPVLLAWWGWVVTLIEALWTGVEVAGRVALAVLQYSVTVAWRAITLLGKGAVELARYAWDGAKIAWRLLRDTYEHVLKPAWQKLWRWVDRVEAWLKRTFGPLLEYLQRVRKWVLDFYTNYIRPVLDVIDVGRRALRILGSLGVEWAKTLDRKLGELEDRITQPFLQLLAKVNEVVNVINRVVTLDGLFQRLALIRSVERDLQPLSRAFVNWRSFPITEHDFEELRKQAAKRSLEDVRNDIADALENGGGRNAALRAEVATSIRRSLARRAR